MEIRKEQLLELTQNEKYIELINCCYDLKDVETISMCDFGLYCDLIEKKGLVSFWEWLKKAIKIILDNNQFNEHK